MLFMFRVCHVFCLFTAALLSPARKGLNSLVYGVLLFFVAFPCGSPGSSVVLDCIDS